MMGCMEAASASLLETWRKPSDDTLDACTTGVVIWLEDHSWLEMGESATSPLVHLGRDAVKAAGEEG